MVFDLISHCLDKRVYDGRVPCAVLKVCTYLEVFFSSASDVRRRVCDVLCRVCSTETYVVPTTARPQRLSKCFLGHISARLSWLFRDLNVNGSRHVSRCMHLPLRRLSGNAVVASRSSLRDGVPQTIPSVSIQVMVSCVLLFVPIVLAEITLSKKRRYNR